MRIALSFAIGLLLGVIVPMALVTKYKTYNTELITQSECVRAIIGSSK